MSLREDAIFLEESKTMGKQKTEGAQGKHPATKRNDDSISVIIGIINAVTWTLGLAIIAWLDWWWPGIMVLVAISAIASPVLAMVQQRREDDYKAEETERALHTARAETLPARCPACGAPLSAATVNWRSPTTATCPYCDTAVKAQ